MNQDTSERQKIRVTIRNEARAAVAEALHAAGIDSTWLTQGDYANIELYVTDLQAAIVIDTVLPAVTLQTRGYPDEVVVASLDPHTGLQPCCKQKTIASDKGGMPYAEE